MFQQNQNPKSSAHFDVGGFAMHICTQGDKTDLPTVIIEGGLGCPAYVYHRLQEELSRHTQTISYDRAGLGLSEESAEPHDAHHIATHLHTLLERANLRGPYVIAGHSLGGLISRVYAQRFPDDVAGLAFVDSSHPRQEAALDWDRSKVRAAYLDVIKDCDENRAPAMFAPIIAAFEDLPGVKSAVADAVKRTTAAASSLAEFDAFDETARQAGRADNLGAMPIAVISATVFKGAPELGIEAEEFARRWTALQQDLACLSSNAHHFLHKGADHMSMVTDAKFVGTTAEAILKVAQLNGGKPPL